MYVRNHCSIPTCGIISTINFVYSMSRRKARFTTRKNYERKRWPGAASCTHLVVSLPRPRLSVVTLLDQLRSTPLPSGWMCTSLAGDIIALCKLSVSSSSQPKLYLMVTISSDMSWGLQIGEKVVDNCLLQSIPKTFSLATEVIGLLRQIDGSQICIGNPDEKFLPLLGRNKGVFKGQSGKF